ncbi:hypothetical protein FUAX_44250 (plasmid) [Fulvitalea axinellae]|uniref:Uncharacterized protein n=1 Tax=Fulvitalea axinellae TaxID=1182444 RepID=A0AAU9D7K6_9BACT|nr:hypothetical protein FUAX_44250 [Fulvitalea axinellae]
MKKFLIATLLSCAFFVANAQEINGVYMGKPVSDYHKILTRIDKDTYEVESTFMANTGKLSVTPDRHGKVAYMHYGFKKDMYMADIRIILKWLMKKYGDGFELSPSSNQDFLMYNLIKNGVKHSIVISGNGEPKRMSFSMLGGF